MHKRVLVINPGNVSTKVAVFDDTTEVFQEKLEHSAEEIKQFARIYDQKEYRAGLILALLEKHGIALNSLQAVVGRGGLLKSVAAGVYQVNDAMLDDVKHARNGEHASNLGPILAAEIAAEAGVPAFIADPVSVDEFPPEARLSGLKELPRNSQSHALNCRAVGMQVAQKYGKSFAEMRMVIAHLGSGISIVAYRDGKNVDNSNPLDGGPMSVDRPGSVPVRPLVKLAFSGKYTEAELLRKTGREGGICDYLGVNDLRAAIKMMEDGDEYAALVLRAMSYQIAKEIGAFSTVLNGKLDCIVLTGGMAHSEWLINDLMPRIDWIAPVELYAGEEEMEALLGGALRVLNGEEELQTY